jgi:hypothetical protein
MGSAKIMSSWANSVFMIGDRTTPQILPILSTGKLSAMLEHDK